MRKFVSSPPEGQHSMSETIITAKIQQNGTIVKHLPNGEEVPLSVLPLREMREEEIIAAATSDHDAQPWTQAALDAAPKIPRCATLRRTLRLTQEAFSTRYRIPLGTLRDWEQGRSIPDQTARAYLTAIAAAPEVIATALQG
jgi:putative transcriptional regulator